LLVDDNDINQTVALGILSQLGHHVDVAGDGLQALAMAEQHTYDAILMDCQMPKLDGYAATVELRLRPGTRSIPIIAMTAATFETDRQRCFDSGMDDFIAKPVRVASLQAILNRWLGTGRGISARAIAENSPGRADTAGRIAELLGGRTSFEVDRARETIGAFLDRTVDLLQRLTLAVAADDAESAHLHARSLAGAGTDLGLGEVVRISREIEAHAQAGRAGLCVAPLVALEVALDRARLQLRDLTAEPPDLTAGSPGFRSGRDSPRDRGPA